MPSISTAPHGNYPSGHPITSFPYPLRPPVQVPPPPALSAFLVPPRLASAAARAPFHDGARWIDVATTLGNVARLDLTGAVGPTLTVLVVWIALPLTAGVVRALRREVH